MEETNKIDGASLPSEADTENGDDEVVTLSKKELEELKRQRTDAVQEAQKMLRSDRIKDDKFQFIKLASSDRKLAEKLAKERKDERSVDQIVKDLKGEKSGGEWEEKLSKEEIKEMLAEEKAEETLKSLLKEYKLSEKKNEELKTKVLDEFEELIGQRKRTPETVKSYFEKAIKLVWHSKDSEDDLTAAGLIWGHWWPINWKSRVTVDFDSLQGKWPKDRYK